MKISNELPEGWNSLGAHLEGKGYDLDTIRAQTTPEEDVLENIVEVPEGAQQKEQPDERVLRDRIPTKIERVTPVLSKTVVLDKAEAPATAQSGPVRQPGKKGPRYTVRKRSPENVPTLEKPVISDKIGAPSQIPEPLVQVGTPPSTEEPPKKPAEMEMPGEPALVLTKEQRVPPEVTQTPQENLEIGKPTPEISTDAIQAVLEEKPLSAPENIDKKRLKLLSTEQAALLEKLSKELGVAEKKVEARAEKAGPEALNAVRKVGEAWKKVPLKYKLAISGGLILSGLGAVTAGSAIAIGGVSFVSVALRGLGMTSLFVGFERMLKTIHEKVATEPRSKRAIILETGTALTLAVVIGLLMPKMLHGLIDAEDLPIAPDDGAIITEAPPTRVAYKNRIYC